MPSSFQELIETSEKPVLVDFYADWCGPCKMVSPAVKQIAADLRGRITTVKVNVDRKQHVAAKHRIQSIPTIMLFHRGRELMRLQGAYPYEQLKSQVEAHLPS
jgi:thioredoxin